MLAVSTAYTLASAFASGGAANTNCAYPEPSADGVQEARPTCGDELCCGAA